MKQINTYFVFSDVHGEYQALLNALKEAGYDENNPTHILISLGDNFDRGPHSKKIWQYLRARKAICVKGNHDVMFQEFLEKGSDGEFVLFNILHNGLGATIKSFSGADMDVVSMDMLNKAKNAINRDSILKWLQNLPLYYETENFIFCHAGINPMLDDWKATSEDYMLWDIQDSHKACFNTNKIVVIGHHHAFRVRENGIKAGMPDIELGRVEYFAQGKRQHILGYGNTDEHRIYCSGNKIAIDGCTNYTGKVNVLVVQDADLEPEPEQKEENTIKAEDYSYTYNVSNDGITVQAT